MNRRRPTAQRGFTLVELLAVVAIVGILAALGMAGFRKYMNSAGSSEAAAVIQGIRGAEEAYKSEMLVYLSCSPTLNAYYPRVEGALDGHKAAWTNSGHAQYGCWQQLNAPTNGAVVFGYAIMAGMPPAITAAPVGFTNPPTWPAGVPEPWYVIQAAGDRDDDNRFALFLTSSLHAEIYSENDSE
jgi:type IV pilus assembly protein PilA